MTGMKILGTLLVLFLGLTTPAAFQDAAMGNNTATVKKEKPDFTYENIDGEEVSLSDFRGKLVYIDIWATWCGPCKREIPYLQSMEEDFHGKDVVFLSLSVDKPSNKDKWKSFVKSKNLSGVQIIADKGFYSDFIREFKVNSIPRFMLISKEGEVLNDNAPRPSMKSTRKMLTEALASE